MKIIEFLNTVGVTQVECYRACGISRTVMSRIALYGEWPLDQGAPARIADYLQSKGLPEEEAQQIRDFKVPSKVKSPGVQQHTEANPEVSIYDQEEAMLLRNESLTQQAKKHFGLSRSPFGDDVTTRADVFASTSTRYVRATLLDAAMNHGFVALTGESGSGKSTLLEELEERIREEQRPIIIIRPYVLAMEENDAKGKSLKSAQIAEAIIRTLVPSESPRNTPEARFRQIHELLKSSRSAGNSHLLVIEEAHCLPIATLKHLKRFLELKLGLARLMGICLVGQTELKTRLSEQSAAVREVVQRCEVIEMSPLDNDLEAYLQHKFERMGLKASDVLADDAYDALRARLITMPRGGKASDAVSICHPLVVNNLVARAMNQAALAGFAKVNAQVIGGC